MSFFTYFFPDVDFTHKETMVCCPYPHKTTNGIEFTESKPSAGINLEKGVFHCLSCGESKSEVGFIKDMLGGTYESASTIKQFFADDEDKYQWDTNTALPQPIKDKILNLGISEAVMNELSIRSEEQGAISFPVFYYDKLIDVRNYRPGETPKIKSRYKAMSGLVIPFDIWRNTDEKRWTWICAGEKDMSVARTHGLNAITITGGERALPSFTKHFENRKVAIVYDNDSAGIDGAKALAAFLKPICAEVRVVTKFHEVCTEKGEDITDFFTKYNKTKEDLIEYLKQTPAFTDEEVALEKEKTCPTLSLLEASFPQNMNKTVRSNIQIVATFESSYVAPTFIEATKVKVTADEKTNLLPLNTRLMWELKDSNLVDLLHLVDNNFSENEINTHIKELLKLPPKETGMSIKKLSKATIFKCAVTDLFEASSKSTNIMEYTAYVIGQKLESGKKYKATYRLIPHPYKGQQLIMIITNVESASDSITGFKITEDVKTNLDVIRNLPGTAEEKLHLNTEKLKGIIGFDANNLLLKTIDLSYHTPLYFNFGRFKHIRAYLDTLVVSESRVGKSSTAEALQKMYGLGIFTSLAGNSATVSGLIGGSNKVNGSFQTRAGLIPQNHQGLIIFEELAKCNSNIIKELTDIKSSNEVRIARVNGSLSLPAMVRMITLTNVKALNGINRPITSYPNGIEVLTELVGTAEDIARFDLMLVLAHRGNTTIDPLWQPEQPFDEAVYKTRVRWVWSRTEDQIVFEEGVEKYIVEQCNILNTKYDCHIKLFGTEAWKKISRLAIAIAGYLVSTDDSYQNLIVKKEHVDEAVKMYVQLYDNETFKFKQYVDAEARYRKIDEDGIEILQTMYHTNATLLNQLEQSSSCMRNELMAATGLDNEKFNMTLNQLVQGLFIRFQGSLILPTERFRIGMSKINRLTRFPKVGEHSDL